MNNVRNTILNKRLPSVIGVFFLILSVGTIAWLSRNAILFGTKAAVDNTPKNVQISNISDTSFTVSYITDDTVVGTINFGEEEKLDQIAFDDRDQASGIAKPYTLHSITIKGLIPATQYAFNITSGDENFSNNNTPYTVTTAPKLTDNPSEGVSIMGKVTLDDGNSPPEALVYLSSNNSQLISTLTKPDGSYQIAHSLRSKALTSFITFTEEEKLQLQIMNATQTSTISLLANNANPVPLIILSKDYDFTISNEPLSPSPIASESAEISQTPPAFPTIAEATGSLPQIINPKDEQTVKDQQPLFRGKAVPNESVTITIHSEETITATVKADSNGNWQYRPDVPLSPGTHTITMRTFDAAGLMRVITKSFVVNAEGSQFVEPSVSPSAQPSETPTPSTSSGPTAKPTATATPKPSATKTPTPTNGSGPTASPSVTKNPTPSPTRVTTITTSVTNPPIPITGNTSWLVPVISFVSVVGIGALLFFLTAV